MQVSRDPDLDAPSTCDRLLLRQQGLYSSFCTVRNYQRELRQRPGP